MPRVTKIEEQKDKHLRSVDGLLEWPILSRRRLLSRGFYTSAGLILRNSIPAVGQAMASPPQIHSDVKLARYVDPLPIPPVIRATGKTGEVIAIEMRQFVQKVHRDLPPTTLWATTARGRVPR